MSEMTAGRAVVELLKADGVKHIFGIVGATFPDVLDALDDDKSVEQATLTREIRPTSHFAFSFRSSYGADHG